MKLTRFLPIPLILVIAALAAACGSDPTPTPIPPAATATPTPEAMMDDTTMKDGETMMDDGTMKDGVTMMDDGAMKDGVTMMDDGAMKDGDAMMGDAMLPEGVQARVSGNYEGRHVEYYDFGANSPITNGVVSTAPIFVFITGLDADGNPLFVKGQHNVIGVVPGDAGYSAFWKVNLVIVPADYVAASIKDVASVMLSGYELVQPGLVVNCPVTVVTPA
jgi:hypothetical protein